MSSIFGFINFKRNPMDSDYLRRMSISRSPSNSGTSEVWSGGHVALGRRLTEFSHQDQPTRQPLLGAGGIVLVAVGRIDNRPELMHLLEVKEQRPQDIADSELILKAYERWGGQCLRFLVGEFSFALWNSREQRLTIVRSPVGGRPIFYAVIAGSLMFSSSPKELLALPISSRTLNLQRVADYLVRAPAEPGATLFNGITRLHPGNMVTVHNGHVNVTAFWKPEPAHELKLSRDEEYVEAFTVLFDRVVKDHLRSSSPVGLMMSGGLDSCSIAALAAGHLRAAGARLTTFTEVPGANFRGNVIKGRYADETPYVEAMAAMFKNIDPVFVRTDGRMYLDDLETFFEASYFPFRNASNRTWFEAILREARNRGVSVLLTGAQGNLTVSRGGHGLLPQMVINGLWLKALQEANAIKPGSAIRTFLGLGVMPLLPPWAFMLVQRWRGKNAANARDSWVAHSAINPDFARSQRVVERAREKGHHFFARTAADTGAQLRTILPVLTMAANDLNDVYRGLCGIDIRDPTADVRIVEFCLSLPEEQYLKDGVSRRLLRRAMATRLPPTVLNNRRRGLQAADWYESLFGARKLILAELEEWRGSELLPGILDLKRLIHLMEIMPSTPENPEKAYLNYRQVVEGGLMMGKFIRWFESGGSGRA